MLHSVIICDIIKKKNRGDFDMANQNKGKVNEQKANEQTIFYFVEDLMLALSFRNNLVGRTYLRDCIVQVCLENKHSINLTEEVYPKIAERYQTSSASVCKAIRHCLITCQNDGNLKRVNKIFRHDIIGKEAPTNAEFVVTMALLIKRYIFALKNKSNKVTYFNF